MSAVILLIGALDILSIEVSKQMSIAKISGMIDTKISVGALALLFVNIVGVIVYIMINLNSIQSLVVKVDKILATQETTNLTLLSQNKDITGAQHDITKLQDDAERIKSEASVTRQTVSNLTIKYDTIQSRFEDVLQASGSKARIRTPQGN